MVLSIHRLLVQIVIQTKTGDAIGHTLSKNAACPPATAGLDEDKLHSRDPTTKRGNTIGVVFDQQNARAQPGE
ncbi:MAG: hypothetical protein IPG66_18380 [Hydrogenophilales bacterium]|nr:hypothetical protein [Hydrogenophilales bacterium]